MTSISFNSKNYTKFLSETEGITSTSANHLANLAKQEYSEAETFLNSLTFIDSYYEVISTGSKSRASIGYDEKKLYTINDKLKEIASLKGFCAWLREAIKFKEGYASEVNYRTTFDDWCVLNKGGKLEPVSPRNNEPLCNITVANDMSIAERADYYIAEAFASTYGSFIHPNGVGHNALKTLQKIINNPINVNANGRDTIIQTYEPSVELDKVTKTFDTIRADWRKYEATVNKVKSFIEDADNTKVNNLNKEANRLYNEYIEKKYSYEKEYNDWVQEEQQRIKKMKIVIPNVFKEVYEHLNNLGK